MRINQKNQKAVLLPNYFKKVGIVVLILALMPAIVVKTMHMDLVPAQKELLKVMTLNVVILGLLFVAWAKDKVEDEVTVALRLQAMQFAFIWARHPRTYMN